MAKKPISISHSEGCQIAARYAKTQMNCGIVFVEPNPQLNSESPDAIGFRPGGCSILFEVKVTRSDFTSDKRKPHRIDREKGMGDYRFYACPEGMIKPEELPLGWGLFYFTPRGSMRPVIVPHQVSALSSPSHYQTYINKFKPGDGIPRYAQELVKTLSQFANPKNIIAEFNILYGGYRMQCVAKKQGNDVVIDEIFQRPEIR